VEIRAQMNQNQLRRNNLARNKRASLWLKTQPIEEGVVHLFTRYGW